MHQKFIIRLSGINRVLGSVGKITQLGLGKTRLLPKVTLLTDRAVRNNNENEIY